MAQVIFNEEWMVEYGLMLRTGLGPDKLKHTARTVGWRASTSSEYLL